MRRVASDNTRDGGGHGSKSEITLGSKLIKRRDLVPHGSWVSTYLDILISYSEIPSLTPRPNSTANAPFYLDPSGSKIAASSSGYIYSLSDCTYSVLMEVGLDELVRKCVSSSAPLRSEISSVGNAICALYVISTLPL
jgi:hypothetical protein